MDCARLPSAARPSPSAQLAARSPNLLPPLRALAPTSCPGQIGEMAVVHDALHLSSDSNTCMQICLPAALRSAPISGVSFGSTCYDLGFSDYAGHDRRDGVEYLTWLR